MGTLRSRPEGHSPHGAQAAAVQLQLAEVGQVHPCAPWEGAVGDQAALLQLPSEHPPEASVPHRAVLVQPRPQVGAGAVPEWSGPPGGREAMGLESRLGAGEPHWHGWGHHSLGPAPEPQGQPRAPQTIASVSSQHWVPEHKKPLPGVPVYPKALAKGSKLHSLEEQGTDPAGWS